MTRLLVAILLFTAVFCEEAYIEKYVSPCPGAISSNSGKSTYNEFLNTTFSQDSGLMKNCTVEYFKTVSDISKSGCTEEHKTCVGEVQKFMWNGCHWRLLYDIDHEKPELYKWIEDTYPDRAEEIKNFFKAMKEDDAGYAFASTCGSWDWVSIIIMICCAFFGSYICLWIVGGIMKAMKKSPEKTEKAE